MSIKLKFLIGLNVSVVIQTLILIYFEYNFPHTITATNTENSFVSSVFTLQSLGIFTVILIGTSLVASVLFFKYTKIQYQDLVASERRLSLTQEISKVGSWELDLLKNKLTWSDEVYRIFGLKPQAFAATYEAFLNAVHPDDRKKVDEAYSTSLKDGRDSYEVEHRVVDAGSGEIKYVLERCKHYKDKAGKVIKSIGMVQDLTLDIMAKQERKHLELQFKAVIDAAPIPFAINKNQDITYLNPAFINTFGYTLNDIPDHYHWWSKAYPDQEYRKFAQQKWDEYIKESQGNLKHFKPLEIEIVCKNGTKKRVLVGATPIGAENLGENLILLQDITESRAQEEILCRATKMQALGSLTGGIAHDYNNMLGVMIGFAELLTLNTEVTEKQRQYIDEILKAGTRSQKLTQNLLNFAKKKSEANKETDLNKIIENDKGLIEKTLTSRIKLKLSLQENLWTILVDPLSFENALINMVINSMHAMPDGGDFEIKTENQILAPQNIPYGINLKSGAYVVLTISDTGVGMNEETLNRVFDPFFTTKSQGTGMGMSQVYSFVNQSDGDIKIESKINQGTKIAIYFPRYSQKNKLASDLKTEAPVVSQKTATILAVDDEASIIELYKDAFNTKHRILTASSGTDALHILKNEKIDILLSDILMPDMDGYTLAEQAKQWIPNIKIQLVSGYQDQTKLKNINEDLKSKILPKPFRVTELYKRIEQLLA